MWGRGTGVEVKSLAEMMTTLINCDQPATRKRTNERRRKVKIFGVIFNKDGSSADKIIWRLNRDKN